MTSRERHETQRIHSDSDRRWKMAVERDVYDRDVKAYVPCAATLRIYPSDDPYYSLEFASRSRLQKFIKQLQALANEVWPT